MANFDAQLARMRELAGYAGVNTGNAPKKTSVNESNFEYQMIGPDGKSYAIVRESKYYYIKSADADKKNLAEAYDYLGGWMGRKNYEYTSYAKALKNFELKMRSLNEAYDVNATVEVLNPTAKNSVLNEATEDMRKEIARQREIMVRAGLIREGKEIGATRKNDVVKFDGAQPEAPKGKKGDEDYKDAESYKGDKDSKKKASQSSKEDGDTYTEKPKTNKKDYVAEGCCGNCEAENGVVSDCMKDWGRKENHSGNATVWDKADMEEPHLNEEENDWGSEGLGETGVGEPDTDHNNGPFTQNVNECGKALNEEDEEFADEDADMDVEADVEDGEEDVFEPEVEFGDEDADFEDDEEIVDDEVEDEDIPVDENDPEAIRAEIERLQSLLGDMEGDGAEADVEADEDMADDAEINSDMETEEEPVLGEDFDGEDFEDEDFEDEDEDFSPRGLNEAKARFMNSIVNKVVKSVLAEERTTLHDFGKHPGYRKKVMSLPQTGADKTEHGEDWNDDSVHNEKPFGEKIGSSAPFDKAVEAITNAVISELKKK